MARHGAHLHPSCMCQRSWSKRHYNVITGLFLMVSPLLMISVAPALEIPKQQGSKWVP